MSKESKKLAFCFLFGVQTTHAKTEMVVVLVCHVHLPLVRIEQDKVKPHISALEPIHHAFPDRAHGIAVLDAADHNGIAFHCA